MAYPKINKKSNDLEKKLIRYRRDFHKYAESGWTEFRTASIVAERLDELGYQVKIGKEIIDDESRMGVPPEKELEKHYERAEKQGASKKYLEKLRDGFTGVMGVLKNGEDPTTAFRFDLDAVEIEESESEDHLPTKKNFASVNENAMHSCGHDGHTAIGLGTAEVLMEIKNSLSGTIKLIFQPAEEGVRGAKSMMEAGIVDDVDYLFGLHLGGSSISSGEIYPGREGFLATTKFDVHLEGTPSHAGGKPEGGKNALLGAANAIYNLYAISRHSDGPTRINVGTIEAGSGRNVIPDKAKLKVETRGETTELENYMYDRAHTIIEKASEMYELEYKIEKMGEAESASSDKELAEIVKSVAEKFNDFEEVKEEMSEGGGSEDFTYFMKKVQDQDGLATFIRLGTERIGEAHTKNFDFNEDDLRRGVKLLTGLAYKMNSFD